MTAAWSLAILMDQLARHVGGRSKYRRLFANSLLNRSVILVLRCRGAALEIGHFSRNAGFSPRLPRSGLRT